MNLEHKLTPEEVKKVIDNYFVPFVYTVPGYNLVIRMYLPKANLKEKLNTK